VAYLLVTGPRDWADVRHVWDVLHYHRQAFPDATLVHGASRGLDAIADHIWHYEWGLPSRAFPVTELDYRMSGSAAPCFRNQAMVDLRPVACLAFTFDPPTPGTSDCVARAHEAGVPVYRHPRRKT
jgi:hypothetical protein